MKKNIDKKSCKIKINKCYTAQTLYEKLREATETKIPLESTTPMIYTERKDGVMAGYDIRTDRWEIAQEQMQKAYKRDIAKRDAIAKESELEGEKNTVSQ